MEEVNDGWGGYGALPESLSVIPEFPMPTEEEQEAVNALFTPYVFYRSVHGGRLLTTSCCGQERVFCSELQRVETPDHRTFMAARHNDTVKCPFCGRIATLKSAGMKRGSLEEFQPVVFLREMNGDLAAIGMWTRKTYKTERDLSARPEYKLTRAYRFTPGLAVMWEEGWDGGTYEHVLTGTFDPKHRIIREPLSDGMFYWNEIYCDYWVAGMDAIDKSVFKFCQYDRFWPYNGKKFHLMEYLAACCIWPRNIEMLMKFGMEQLVRDLVLGERKNARLFLWGEEDPKKAFGLDGQEWRAFAGTGYDLETLGIYKKLRSGGYRHSFALATDIKNVVGERGVNWFLRACKETGLKPARVIRWLGWSDQLCSRGAMEVRRKYGQWKDYIGFCQRLGYDLTDQTVAIPKDFERRHDEAAGEVQRRERIEKEKRDAEMRRRFEQSLSVREEKYNFALDGLFIRCARSDDEIVAEGSALKHCVGVYAGRHMEGVVTILFLRRMDAPDEPYVTVKMDGNRLMQAHGYNNDRGAAGPLDTHKVFFDTWLDWVMRGSPRNKRGAPRLRRGKGANAA